MTLTFSQGHRVTEKLELVHSFCGVKLHEATQKLVMVDFARDMTLKSSFQYGKYGSFQHLLFVLSSTLIPTVYLL